MLNVNKVTLIGRLGADPEIIEYGEDKKLLKLSVGTNDFAKKCALAQRCRFRRKTNRVY